MWKLLSDEFAFSVVRLNQQGIYKPGEMPAESATGQDQGSRSQVWVPERKLAFRFVSEAVLDIQPTATKLRWLLRRGAPEGPGEAEVDASLLLCTIPAFACSAFVDLPLPMVMYAANPLTAQVPFTQHDAWLALFGKLAADPKNHLLVSNPWSQAQFEYQAGISLPVIRVHGLYANAKHSPEDSGPHSTEVLVYDRTSPLLARVLQALLKSEGKSRLGVPSRFVHHGSTDREYKTFASFAAVVFVPGDVEQMAFYEFYSMDLPVFVPADPGRYMWPRLPGGPAPDNTCGQYAEWVGTWELRYASGVTEVLAIDCAGRSELAGGGVGKMRPLARMDERGFSHCLVLGRHGRRHVARRLRLSMGYLQAVRLESETPCEGSFAEAFATGPGDPGAASAIAEGVRSAGEPTPQEPTLWDHDIFASVAWFLEGRLGGPSRAKHSPFDLGSVAAAREWASVMDYFRFPAVGLFVSAAELVAALADGGGGSLRAASREMHGFNERELRHSLRQWRSVLSEAVP